MNGRRIRIRGQVQGVGFRPFIWKLAQEFGLHGTVCNDGEGVLIDVFGQDLDAFEEALRHRAPPISNISALESKPIPFAKYDGFEIIASKLGIVRTGVTPDLALCAECAAEISTIDERRFGYAFTNCTNCGPRLSIVQSLPYDRAHTVMTAFPLCSACQAQYDDPRDRRFHAQPIACPKCGPEIEYHGLKAEAALKAALDDLRAGKILAIKGLGGFHLVVDGHNAKAIEHLRLRKNRPTKPFALMANEAVITQYAQLDEASREALRGAAAPIVLLPHKRNCPEALAPGQNRLGFMLPYTPLHKLLADGFGGILVMTSANLSGEPQIIENDEALTNLAEIADRFLIHNRPIARRVDDSLVQIFNKTPLVLRRARGFAPTTLRLPPGFENAPNIVGFGAFLKTTLTMIKTGEALMTHHLGDLDNWKTRDAYEQAYQDYSALFEHQAEYAALDLHPDFPSRHFAESLGLKTIDVQHHHAHMAATMAEHLLPLDHEPILGIVLDGLGLGNDKTVWGGEILCGTYRDFKRVAWLKAAPLLGGDLAQKQPWRNSLAQLDQAGLAEWADQLFANFPVAPLRAAQRSGMNAPLSSSAGRLFDAIAGVLGICPAAQSFEGEAAMAIEALAWKAPKHDAHHAYPFKHALSGEIDPAPIWEFVQNDLKNGVALEVISLRFHAGLAHVFAEEARRIAKAQKINVITLSGGVMQNLLLLKLLSTELSDFKILYPQNYPANDGGVSLGQAVIAAAQLI